MERQKERIAHYWGQRSEGFRQAHQGEWDSPTASVYREVISSHLSKPGAAILDVGTGSGFFPLLLKDLDAQITGIETGEGCRKGARRLCPVFADGCRAPGL